MNTFFIGYNYSGGKFTNSSFSVEKNQGHTFDIGFGKTHINPLFGKIYSTITTNFYGEYYYRKNENFDNAGTLFSTNSINNYSANINIGLGLMYRVTDRFAVTTTINNFLSVVTELFVNFPPL